MRRQTKEVLFETSYWSNLYLVWRSEEILEYLKGLQHYGLKTSLVIEQ
jgi:hypothetical protein